MTPAFEQDGVTLYQGHTLDLMRALPAESAQMCLTSPPYFGLRRYLPEDSPLAQFELGREETPEEYVANLVDVLAEVRRVLRPDGTLWLNLADSYSHGGCGARDPDLWPKQSRNDHMPKHAKRRAESFDPKYPLGRARAANESNRGGRTGLPPKSLLGMPWRVAFALQAQGWVLRSAIVWAKTSPMPGSMQDRPTSSYEHVFLLAKQGRYFYDAQAIRERAVSAPEKRTKDTNYAPPGLTKHTGFRKHEASARKTLEGRRDADFDARWYGKNEQLGKREYDGFNARWDAAEAAGETPLWRNKRDVWTLGPEPFREVGEDGETSHFAVMPSELARLCISAGSKPSNGGGEFGRFRSGRGPLRRGLNHGIDRLPFGPARSRARVEPRLHRALRPSVDRGHAAAAPAPGGFR